MKKTLLSSFILCILLLQYNDVLSQDIIKLKNGEEIHARNISVLATEVRYKYFYIDDSEIFSSPKKDVSYIQYQNGARETFDAPSQTTSSGSTYSTTTENKSNDALAKQMEKQNAALVDAILGLKENMADLKTAIEKGNEESKKQNQELVEKMDELNKALSPEQTASNKTTNAEGHRKFGFGVNFLINFIPRLLANSADNLDSPQSILISGAGLNIILSGTKKNIVFRFEPHFDIFSSASTAYNNIEISRFINTGARLFAVARRNKVNIYGGPALSFFNLKDTYSGLGLGLHAGGEYLVTNHFGICMESGLQSYIILDPINGATLTTFGRLGGRFYF